MPSVTSLNKHEYYAHPRNAFWWLTSKLLGVPFQADYKARAEQLMLAGIAVWDVLYDCDRAGSLDSNIVRSSETANDIEGLLTEYSTIRLIAFNGGAANAIFKRHCQFDSSSLSNIKRVQLPSSSPAHASISRDQKLAVWRTELGSVLPTI